MAITAEKLSVANYNKLDNIPVINQDLTASDFTPVKGTYYRHTGSGGSAYTIGAIYYYNGTEYKALDGSGGGTTLNKYTYFTKVNSLSGSKRFARIIANCKGRCTVYAIDQNCAPLNAVIGDDGSTLFLTGLTIDINGVNMVVFSIYVSVANGYRANFSHYFKLNIADNTIDNTYDYSNDYLLAIYFNDTEIT